MNQFSPTADKAWKVFCICCTAVQNELQDAVSERLRHHVARVHAHHLETFGSPDGKLAYEFNAEVDDPKHTQIVRLKLQRQIVVHFARSCVGMHFALIDHLSTHELDELEELHKQFDNIRKELTEDIQEVAQRDGQPQPRLRVHTAQALEDNRIVRLA